MKKKNENNMMMLWSRVCSRCIKILGVALMWSIYLWLQFIISPKIYTANNISIANANEHWVDSKKGKTIECITSSIFRWKRIMKVVKSNKISSSTLSEHYSQLSSTLNTQTTIKWLTLYFALCFIFFIRWFFKKKKQDALNN